MEEYKQEALRLTSSPEGVVELCSLVIKWQRNWLDTRAPEDFQILTVYSRALDQLVPDSGAVFHSAGRAHHIADNY